MEDDGEPFEQKMARLTATLAEREACARYQVRRLELFGSAVRGAFDPQRSDLDFLVEFGPLQPGQYADTYFGLLEALQALFGRSVDLVMVRAIRNPSFRANGPIWQKIRAANLSRNSTFQPESTDWVEVVMRVRQGMKETLTDSYDIAAEAGLVWTPTGPILPTHGTSFGPPYPD